MEVRARGFEPIGYFIKKTNKLVVLAVWSGEKVRRSTAWENRSKWEGHGGPQLKGQQELLQSQTRVTYPGK